MSSASANTQQQSLSEVMNFRKSWRVYQSRLLDHLDRYLANKSLHLVAAPGSGKTVLGLEVFLPSILPKPCPNCFCAAFCSRAALLSHVAARLLVLPSHRGCLTAKRWQSALEHTPQSRLRQLPPDEDSEPPSEPQAVPNL